MTGRPSLGATLLVAGERIPMLFEGDAAVRILKALTAGEDTRRRQLIRAVRGYLEAHPDATANEIARVLGGRRAETLAVVRLVRTEPELQSKPTPPGRAGSGVGNHRHVATRSTDQDQFGGHGTVKGESDAGRPRVAR